MQNVPCGHFSCVQILAVGFADASWVCNRYFCNFLTFLFQNFFIKGGNSFQFIENSIDVLNGLAFELRNLKNIHFNGNQVGFPIKSPNILFYYKEKRSDCEDSELDLPENKIGEIQIKHNRFSNLVEKFFEVDKDPKYSDQFVTNKLKVESNEISKRCNCTKYEVPEEPTDNEAMRKAFDNGAMRKAFVSSSR